MAHHSPMRVFRISPSSSCAGVNNDTSTVAIFPASSESVQNYSSPAHGPATLV